MISSNCSGPRRGCELARGPDRSGPLDQTLRVWGGRLFSVICFHRCMLCLHFCPLTRWQHSTTAPREARVHQGKCQGTRSEFQGRQEASTGCPGAARKERGVAKSRNCCGTQPHTHTQIMAVGDGVLGFKSHHCLFPTCSTIRFLIGPVVFDAP